MDEMNQGVHLLESLTKPAPTYDDTLTVLTLRDKVEGRILRHCTEAGNAVKAYRKKLAEQEGGGEKKS